MLLVQYQRAKQLGKAIGQELVDSISFLFHLQILDFGISSLLPLGTLDEHSLSLSVSTAGLSLGRQRGNIHLT